MQTTDRVMQMACLQIEGAENLPPPNQPAVYVSNHQSFLVSHLRRQQFVHVILGQTGWGQDRENICIIKKVFLLLTGHFHIVSPESALQVCFQDQQLSHTHCGLEHVSHR